MSTNKKYDYRVVKGKTDWTAEIIRRVTSKKTSVSKSQGGFASEEDARAWGEKELGSFLANLAERNKRDAVQRQQQKEERVSRASAYKQRKQDLANAAMDDDDPESPDE
jgi:hypothetical protein